MVRKETRAYEEKLQEELNIDREKNEKKPFPPEKFRKEKWKEIKESTTDPESGYYVKDERTKQFAYSFHATTDEHGFILATIVTPGNIHDSHMLQPLVEKVIEKVKKPLAVAADAAYKTPVITNFLLENQMLPVLPYTRPKTKDGFFRKRDYIYDEHYDCYICPNNQTLPYVTTTKERSSFYVHFYPSFHFATLYLDENNETFPETLYNISSLYDRRINKNEVF